tara:strand:- start:368 stop:703 length:336 start_codon:yes stop_codon:yes gene_type:complete
MSVKMSKLAANVNLQNKTIVRLKVEIEDIGSDEISWVDPDTEYEYRAKLVVVKREQDPLYKDKDWLHEKYVVEGLPCSAIGNMFGLSPMTIYKWLKKHDIPTRPRGRWGKQ